jgi:hypothetical protein
MSTALVFEPGDFVFVLSSSVFFGFVFIRDEATYDVAPAARWDNGNPYVTHTCLHREVHKAVWSFHGPLARDHQGNLWTRAPSSKRCILLRCTEVVSPSGPSSSSRTLR